MASTTQLVVPTNTVKVSGPHETLTLVAEGAITPGEAVKFGSSQAQVVVCGVTDPLCIGVADKNQNAAVIAGTDPMTTDYAAGDEVMVITKGRVRAIADTAGITRGTLVKTGAVDGGKFEDIGAGTFDEVVGRALTTAASGAAFILDLK